MKTKFQVFVSSTYEDLKAERDQTLKAILEMGHIPVGMELFSAGDEQQWELIKRQIDDSDYYLVVIAHRYGSRDEDISFTEKEYDYAVTTKVPVLGFIISDEAMWPSSSVDKGIDEEALRRFKEKVKKKIVSFWNSGDDLHAKVSIALGKAITAYPRPGWVRSTESVGPEVMRELSRLSKENSELRDAIATAASENRDEQQQEDRKTLDILSANTVRVNMWFVGSSDWEDVDSVTLHRIFRLLAPEMMVEKTAKASSEFLGYMLRPVEMKKRRIDGNWPIAYNTLRGWFADLHALGLIAPSMKKHHIKDAEEYWSITERGKRIYSSMRLDFLQRQLESSRRDHVRDASEIEEAIDSSQPKRKSKSGRRREKRQRTPRKKKSRR